MNSVNFQNNISFTSRNRPIKPQIFHSAKGDITISEATKQEAEEVFRFAEDTAIEFHEYLAHLKTPDFASLRKENTKKGTRFLEGIMNQYDGNSTILIARDENKKIVGTSLLKILRLKGKQTIGEMGNFYIAEPFRKIGIGEKLGQLLIDNVKGVYTDIFLAAENTATGFYEKLGFKTVSKTKTFEAAIAANLEKTSMPNTTIYSIKPNTFQIPA